MRFGRRPAFESKAEIVRTVAAVVAALGTLVLLGLRLGML